MKKLLSKIKANNEILNSLDSNYVEKKITIKTLLFTLLIAALTALPFVLIYIELLKQFSPVIWFYYVIIVLVFISVYVFVPYTMMIYYTLLKNYSEKEEVQKIEPKYVFIGDLLNPLYFILGLIVIFVLMYFLG